MNMNEKGQLSMLVITYIAIALLIGAVIGWSVKSSTISDLTVLPGQTQSSLVNTSQNKLSKDMRKLWEDHITWTRAYLVSAAFDNKDADNVAARLLKNQEDIGNAIKPIYGEEAGNKLTALLKIHITTAVDLVKAIKEGDQNVQTQASDKWYTNANDIADFLAAANPNWPKDQVRAEMKEHLDLTGQEAIDILGNKYDAGIADYDKVHEQILIMADMLTEGIIKQFPDKFK